MRPGRHRGGQLPVERDDELVRTIVRGEEAGDVETIDLIRARGRERRVEAVEGVRTGADEPEQARAAAAGNGALRRFWASGRIEPRGEGVRHDEVPVAPGSGCGQPLIRRLPVEEPGREEEGSVVEPDLRPPDCFTQPSLEPVREPEAPLAEPAHARVHPCLADPAQPLPRDGVGVEPVDGIGDVRREALALEQAVSGGELPLEPST